MADYKYVMFQDKDGRCIPVIFPGTLVHADVARGVAATGAIGRPYVIVSAGHIHALHVSGTFGDSETLSRESDPRDAEVINHYPYSNGLPDTVPGLSALMREAFMRILAGDGK